MRKHDSDTRDVICHDCNVHFSIFSFLMNIVGFLSSANFKIILNELIKVSEINTSVLQLLFLPKVL